MKRADALRPAFLGLVLAAGNAPSLVRLGALGLEVADMLVVPLAGDRPGISQKPQRRRY